MTPELTKLRATDELEAILENLEFRWIDDPAWGEPSDTSYLSAKERKDPDIASNVEAMAETNKLISWFGTGEMGHAGLWRGPKGHKLEVAPVVVLDTEGQYSIAGTTIADFLAMAAQEDDFDEVRTALVDAGFKVGKSRDAIYKTLDKVNDDPNEYRNELYNQSRVKRGLKPVD